MQQDAVLLIGRQSLRVDGVGAGSLDLGNEALVKEDLADVGGGQIQDCAIGSRGGIEVDQDVNVGGSSRVVARDEGLEERDTVVVSLLNTTEEGGVEVGGVGGGVTVAIG